jgi:hypothetical protein
MAARSSPGSNIFASFFTDGTWVFGPNLSSPNELENLQFCRLLEFQYHEIEFAFLVGIKNRDFETRSPPGESL